MIKKGLAIAVILLFIGVSIVPSSAVQEFKEKSSPISFDGNTLYVGGTGPGNYSTIREALDNASSGDTIFVYSGTYGRFHVRKSVQIIGENKYTTILDGNWNYNTISIEANNLVIKGFTVIKGKFGISLQQRNNVIVSDMLLTNNDLGIMHNWNSNVHLNNISFYDNGKAIDTWDSSNCTITHCTFDNDGIYIGGYPPSGTDSLFIRNNLFTNNSSIGLGWLCLDTHGNTVIESNIFQNNTHAITTKNNKGVNIINNNFINNEQHILLRKEYYIIQIPLYLFSKQNWINNYWDDWDQTGRYTISGTWSRPYFPNIGIPFREFDWHPAKEPFDIEV